MPSLYESTVNTGEVSSSNFTTLYNASGLAVPNAGAGSVTGNLNVGGNLIVQGTSTLIGAVNLQSTLSLPNYTFPLLDGTTDQVLTSDGSGNLFFTSVSALGASYTIQADTATGGANLTLVSSGGVLDSVKFAGSGNTTVTRTDANTITINAADELPAGTAQGQVLYWNGTDWEANNVVTSTSVGNRLTSEYLNSDASISASFRVRRNFGSTVYNDTNFTSMLYQAASDTQAATSIGSTGFATSADPAFIVSNSTDNFSTSTRLMTLNQTTVRFNGTNIVLNTNHTGAPTLNAAITVERGSSTDATLTWDESQDRWEFNNPLEVQGQITGTVGLDLNGDTIVLRSGSPTQGNAQIIVNRGASPDARLTWNDTQDRWEFNESLFGSTTAESPAQFERLVASAEINNAFESKAALRLTERVTDAVSNDTDQGGTGIVFSRASGTTPGSAERTYGIISSRFYGTTNTADIVLQWSNDNFTEPTPGSFPGTYTLMRAGSNDTLFSNDSLYLNYSTQGTASIATSITGGNTLVFGTAHGFVSGERIYYTSTTQNGLTQNTYYYVLATGLTATECRIGLTVTGSAVALTNGTGLSLSFSELINRVGVNNATPGYTLDVDGDTNISGDVIVSGVKFDLSTPVQQGQMLYVSDAVTPTITNSSSVIFNSTANRPAFVSDIGVSGRVSSAASFINDTGATAYGQGDGASILLGVDSDSQARKFLASFASSNDLSNNLQIRLSTSTNSFANINGTTITGGNTITFSSAHGLIANQKIVYLTTTQNGLTQNTYYYVLAAGLTSTQCQLSATQGGTALVLTNGTGLILGFQTATTQVIIADDNQLAINGTNFVLNNNGAGLPAQDALIRVKRGTTGADAELFWNETLDRWYFDNGNGTDHPMVISIDDLSDVTITPPTASGQFLWYNGTAWVNDNRVTSTTDNDRAVFEFNPSTPSTRLSALLARKNTSTTPYVTGDGAGIGLQLDSNSQTVNTFGFVGAIYDATTPNITLRTSTDSFSSNSVEVAAFSNTNADIGAPTLTLDADNTGAAVNQSIVANRGSSGADATLTWDESQTRWEFNNALEVQGQITGTAGLDLNGDSITLRSGAVVDGDANIVVDRGPGIAAIKWDSATDRWQTSVDGSTYLNIPNQNLDLTSDVTFSSINLDGVAVTNTFAVTTTSTAQFTLDQSARNTIKAMVFMQRGTDTHTLEILIMRTSTDAMITTYGEMYTTAPLAAFTADLSGGQIRIRATPTSATSTTFSTVRTALT